MNQLRNGFLAHYVNQQDVATMVQRHPDPIIVANHEKEIVYTNTAGARLLCRLPDSHGSILPVIDQALGSHYLITINDANGNELSFDVKRTELHWNDQTATMFTLHDVTSHRLYCNELEQLVYSDHLTGLYNSRGLEVIAAHVRSIACRNKQSITSFYIDVNNLKKVNDDYGHSMGDAVIVETANVISHCFRHADVSARVGGDEFVVLTLDESGESIDGMLERLEAEINRRNLQNDRCYELSISVGVSCHQADHQFNVQQLIKEADSRMYTAKKQLHKANFRKCNIHWPLVNHTDFDSLLEAV